MPASYLHGVETIEIEKGARTIRTVKTAVVGLVGTAPIQNVDDEYKTINEPVLISSDVDAVKYFGNATDGFTIPQALDAIFDQGAGVVLVVNVFDPEKHNSVSDVTKADIIGSVDANTGKEPECKHLKIVIHYLDSSLKRLLLQFIVKIKQLFLKFKLYAIKLELSVLLMLR